MPANPSARDLLPRQAPLQQAHRIALPRKRLLLLEKFAARRQPVFVRHDRMVRHGIIVGRHFSPPESPT